MQLRDVPSTLRYHSSQLHSSDSVSESGSEEESQGQEVLHSIELKCEST